jgi:hypothetical protein
MESLGIARSELEVGDGPGVRGWLNDPTGRTDEGAGLCLTTQSKMENRRIV